MRELTHESPRDADLEVARRDTSRRRAFRPREIARLYGLAPATVYAACYEGRLKFHRVGKAIVIPVEAIDEWMGPAA